MQSISLNISVFAAAGGSGQQQQLRSQFPVYIANTNNKQKRDARKNLRSSALKGNENILGSLHNKYKDCLYY